MKAVALAALILAQAPVPGSPGAIMQNACEGAIVLQMNMLKKCARSASGVAWRLGYRSPEQIAGYAENACANNIDYLLSYLGECPGYNANGSINAMAHSFSLGVKEFLNETDDEKNGIKESSPGRSCTHEYGFSGDKTICR